MKGRPKGDPTHERYRIITKLIRLEKKLDIARNAYDDALAELAEFDSHQDYEYWTQRWRESVQ